MQIYQIQFGTPEFDQAVRLRQRLLREPLGLEFSAEQFDEEYKEFHLAAFSNRGELVGYLNLTPLSDEEVKMRQVAVDPGCQGKGVGKALVLASEALARQAGFKRIILHARETAIPFYLKLDYSKFGKPFTEVTIPHMKMKKVLS